MCVCVCVLEVLPIFIFSIKFYFLSIIIPQGFLNFQALSQCEIWRWGVDCSLFFIIYLGKIIRDAFLKAS